MNTFIISFRESLEAALIVGIIYTLLHKKSLLVHIKYLWFGLASAIVSSVLIAFFLKWTKSLINNESIEKLMEGSFMILTAAFVFYVIFWLSKQVSSSKELQDKTLGASEKKWGVFWLVYFTVLREGFETVLMLMPSETMEGEAYFYLKFLSGIVLAVLLGYLIFFQGIKVDIRKFFKVTYFFLVIFASGMVAYGVHELEEFFVKGDHLSDIGIENEKEIGRVWNILVPVKELPEGSNEAFYSYNQGKGKYIHIFHDKGSIGGFLKGFVGYNSNPNWVEFILWMVSLLFGLYLWRKG